MTFAQEIEGAAAGPIEAVVIGGFGWSSIGEDNPYGEERIKRERTPPVRGKVLDWATAKPMLDYTYDYGFGAPEWPECDAVWAWSADRVVFVSAYDGSTAVEWLPRNPTEGAPGMYGGG